MAKPPKPQKPKTVIYAEWALGAWTAWFCLFGLYQSWAAMPGLQKMMNEQLQGMIIIAPGTILKITISFYAFMAMTLVYLIYKIDQGKNWARVSLLLNLAAQLLLTVIPPYKTAFEYLPDIPDLGLQAYALYLLYTWPGRAWFTRKEWARDLPA